MALFRNFYRCARCGHEWTDNWSGTSDDDCPACGARHMSPYQSEDTGDDEDIEREEAANETARH
jgi:DNA-directed RNA polymerase subunit RPC12/RpoP